MTFPAVTRVVNQEACQLDEAGHQLAVAVAFSLRYCSCSNQLPEMADACALFALSFPDWKICQKYTVREKILFTASTADSTKWNSLDT